MALGTNGDRCQTHSRSHIRTHTHTCTHIGVAHKGTNGRVHTLALAPTQRQSHTTQSHTHTNTSDVRSICVREGLDVVAQCREQEKNPKHFDFIGNTDYTEIDYLDASKKGQRVGNGRWCNSPVNYTFVCLYISISLRPWQLSVCAFLHFKSQTTTAAMKSGLPRNYR